MKQVLNGYTKTIGIGIILVAAAVGYGELRQTVAGNSYHIQEFGKTLRVIEKTVHVIEGKMDAHTVANDG